MKLKALIIDDEKPSRENLFAIIQNYFDDIDVLGQAGSIDEAIRLIRETNPDLLFLDVELGVGTGLDLLNMFDSPSFEVIFITAFNQYAAKAFRTSAVDYLLKPVDLEEMREALNKVKEKIEYRKLKNSPGHSSDNGTAHNGINNTGFVKVYTEDGSEIISSSEILFIQSINYYSKIVLVNKREIISTRHLKEYEEQLKIFGFFRIHNSFIINIKYIKGIYHREGYMVTLMDDIKLKISRRRKEEFLKFLDLPH
jgi:two-component system, LytTR family, response regulator